MLDSPGPRNGFLRLASSSPVVSARGSSPLSDAAGEGAPLPNMLLLLLPKGDGGNESPPAGAEKSKEPVA